MDAFFGANLFQFRLPLCLQFVDGDHDQAESGKRLLSNQVSTRERQHGGCMQSCNGIPKVWVGVVSLMAIVWMLPLVQILFQFRVPLCLQFVDGDHDQAESGKGFCQTKCPHMKGSMVGACNHAMAFLKCGLEWFP